METDDTKAALRRQLRARRDAQVAGLDPAARALAFRVPPTPLAAWIEAADCVAGYAPIGSEADPAALLRHAAARGIAVALPALLRPHLPMRFLRWQPGAPLVAGPFGTRQPDPATAAEVTPTLILAPLLGFDRRLHRLGQGAGCYDRAFARFPDARRVGIAWSGQELPAVPDDPWDVPLDAVLTEREWIA